MIDELPIVILIAGEVLVGLWLSNIVYDKGVPHYISRKIGHAAGGSFWSSYTPAELKTIISRADFTDVSIESQFGLILASGNRAKTLTGANGIN